MHNAIFVVVVVAVMVAVVWNNLISAPAKNTHTHTHHKLNDARDINCVLITFGMNMQTCQRS